MKKFMNPVMSIQKLDKEEIIRTSGGTCFEIFQCVDCYCTAVTCDPVYTCDGLKCPSLD